MELTLSKALEILNINDPDKITVAELTSIKRKASLRWHPDVLARKGLADNQEAKKRFEENFRLIDDSIELIRQLLNGEYNGNQKYVPNHAPQQTQQPEEILRQNAPHMQQTLRQVWQTILSKGYKKHEEEVVLSEGTTLTDLLDAEIADEVPARVITSLSWMLYILALIWLFNLIPYYIFDARDFSEGVNTLLSVTAVIMFVVHFMVLLPLSQVWLPPIVYNTFNAIVNFGSSMYMNNNSDSILLMLILMIPPLIGLLFNLLVMRPVYFLVGLAYGDKIFRRVTRQTTFYANVADWYIEQLLSKPPTDLTTDELFVLSHLYTQLSDAR